MPAFFGDDQVRRIKERIDLVQLMSEYTPMRKAGANYTGCCPFHQERSPSMYVYPDQGTYYCFGCQAHGDCITLIRERERLEFSDALALLAKRAGIVLEVSPAAKQARDRRDSLLPVVEFATSFYEKMLWEDESGSEARAYLAKRGLDLETCKRFRLGWAPGSSRLITEANRKRIPYEHLLAADLAIDRNGRPGDRFFERLTFPIADRFGNPVAFSARLMPAAEKKAKEAGIGVGKYVNSTDTPLYHKGSLVFNLHRARTQARERGRILVMEGPTDVMAAEQAGCGGCVAVLGTALTAEHARQLGNLVGVEGKVIILLDGDRAGQANSLKAVRTCLGVGVPVKVAVLPDEMDPAELLAENAKTAEERAAAVAVLDKVIAGARADVDHLLRTRAPRPHELDHRGRLALVDELVVALRPTPDATLRELHLRDIADYLGLDRKLVLSRLAAAAAAPVAATSGDPRGNDAVHATASAPASPAAKAQAAAISAAAAQAAATAAKLPVAVPLGNDDEALLHILFRETALRAVAADDLHLEPAHFPAPWDTVAACLFEPGNDLDHVLELPAAAQPLVRETVFSWANRGLADRRPAIGDARLALGQLAARKRVRVMQDELLRLARAISDAPDAATRAELGKQRLDLQRTLNDLRMQES
jgi:DNA primase